MNAKKIVIWSIRLLIFLAGWRLWISNTLYQNNLGKDVNKKISDAQVITCERTVRLDNLPHYDRALSLIGEKYGLWELQKTYYCSFPSELINCIKIKESEVRERSGLEGYFVFHSDDIEDNYFPIVVDNSYSETDNFLTAILLVHEITHVQQYLDVMNEKENLSCLDMEVEAFYSSWNFFKNQPNELVKSINLRIKYDEDLHPQLMIIKAVDDYLVAQENFDESFDKFLKGESVDEIIKKQIKKIISKDEYYKEQCNL